MVDNINLTAALTTLAEAITTLNNANVAAANTPPPPHAAHVIVLYPFSLNAPFDLSTQTGSSAFTTTSAALDDPWDG
jgi:hypothetical protein